MSAKRKRGGATAAVAAAATSSSSSAAAGHTTKKVKMSADAKAGGSKHEAAKRDFIALCQRYPSGLLASDLNRLMGDRLLDVAQAINELLKEQRVQLLKKGRETVYKLVAQDEANKALAEQRKLKGLTRNEQAIFHLIKQVGNKGIWIKHIRTKSRLPQNQVSKILKSLTQKKLVKCERSIEAKNKKVYMLFDLEPAQSIIGPCWYVNGVFDKDIRDILAKTCRKLIQKADTNTATAEQITEFINNNRLLKTKKVTTVDILALLNSLVFDDILEPCADPNAAEDDALMAGLGYVEVAPAQQHYRESKSKRLKSPFTQLPCSVCPVADVCEPGGKVSPQTCAYLERWLEF